MLFQRLRSTAFLWHNYGNTTIGARSDVEGVPIDKLQAFYRQWYQPDNATLVIAGRIDSADVLARVARHFGPLKKPARVLPRFYTTEPAQDGEREVTVRRVGNLRLVAAAYHTPALAHPDNAPLSVLANVLGHTPGGRLHKALVEAKLAAAAGANGESMRDPGLLTAIAVVPNDGDAAKAEAELLSRSNNSPRARSPSRKWTKPSSASATHTSCTSPTSMPWAWAWRSSSPPGTGACCSPAAMRWRRSPSPTSTASPPPT